MNSAKVERNIGVFGISPGSIAAIDTLSPSVVFTKEGGARERRSIYTTTIGYEPLFTRYVPKEALMPMSSIRTITRGGTDITVATKDRYFMVDYPRVMQTWQQQAAAAGTNVEVLPASTRKEDIQVVEKDGSVVMQVHGGKYEFDSVVDASGTAAVIASQVEPRRKNENYLAEYACAGTFKGSLPKGQMILIFGPAGGTSWANPSIYQDAHGEPLIDVVFSGWEQKVWFDHFKNGDGRARLRYLTEFLQDKPNIEIYDPEPLDITYGMIRSQEVPRPRSRSVFATGEAGGTAKPFTGESFNRALRAGEMAAEKIRQGESPEEYYDAFHSRYKGEDTFYSIVYQRLNGQRTGQIGPLIDQMAEWFSEGAKEEKLVAELEKFIIDGKIPARMKARLIARPYYIKTVLKIARTVAEVKLKGPENMPLPADYSFPPLIQV